MPANFTDYIYGPLYGDLDKQMALVERNLASTYQVRAFTAIAFVASAFRFETLHNSKCGNNNARPCVKVQYCQSCSCFGDPCCATDAVVLMKQFPSWKMWDYEPFSRPDFKVSTLSTPS